MAGRSGGSLFQNPGLFQLGGGGSSINKQAASVRASSAPPGADAAHAAAAAAALQQVSIHSEQDAASREAQDAEYEQGLPYLRGMPEAFMPCADVTLVVGQRELPVHSQVLASKSTFFANMWADMGDFENGGKPDPASAHVTPKTAISGALSGRELRDILLFLDAVYRGVGLLNLAGNSGPGPDVFAEYAVFAERAGLGAFQAKWEAVLIDDWEIAGSRKASCRLLQLAPETLLRVANGHDFLRRHGHRPPSKLLRGWRRTADLTLEQ